MSTQKSRFEAPAPLPAAVKASMPSLDDIAATTDSTYTAARYAPKDYEDLKLQATDAYDSGVLRKEYYPPTRKKEWDPRSRQWDWRDVKLTPEQLEQYRRKGILMAVQVARRGATLNMLPEVAWAEIYAFDGLVIIGCHAMKGAILSLKTCLEWTEEEILGPNSRTIGYKMRVVRLLSSGRENVTRVDVHENEFAHLMKGDKAKETWLLYGADMLYAACVRRAANHSFPDRVRGMAIKEEFVVAKKMQSEATPEPDGRGIDGLLQEMMDSAPEQETIGAREPVPGIASSETTREPAAEGTPEKHPLLDAIERADATTDWAALAERCRAEPKSVQDALRAAWAANPNNPSRVGAQAPQQAPADTTPETP